MAKNGKVEAQGGVSHAGGISQRLTVIGVDKGHPSRVTTAHLLPLQSTPFCPYQGYPGGTGHSSLPGINEIFILKTKQSHKCSKSWKWNKSPAMQEHKLGGLIVEATPSIPPRDPQSLSSASCWHLSTPVPLQQPGSPVAQPSWAFGLLQGQAWVPGCMTFQHRHSSFGSAFQCLNSRPPGGQGSDAQDRWGPVT